MVKTKAIKTLRPGPSIPGISGPSRLLADCLTERTAPSGTARRLLLSVVLSAIVLPRSIHGVSFDIFSRQAFVETHGVIPGESSYSGPSTSVTSSDPGVFDHDLSSSLTARGATGSASASASQTTDFQLEPGSFAGTYDGLYFHGEATASASASISGDFGKAVSGQGVAYITLRFVVFDPTPFYITASTDHTYNSRGGGGVYFWLQSTPFSATGVEKIVDLGGDGVNAGAETATRSGVLEPGYHYLQAMIHVGAYAIAYPAPAAAEESGSMEFRFGLGTLTHLASAPPAVPEAGSTLALLSLGFAASIQLRRIKQSFVRIQSL